MNLQNSIVTYVLYTYTILQPEILAVTTYL